METVGPGIETVGPGTVTGGPEMVISFEVVTVCVVVQVWRGQQQCASAEPKSTYRRRSESTRAGLVATSAGAQLWSIELGSAP